MNYLMRRFIACAVIIGVLASALCLQGFAQDHIKVVVDGEELVFDVQPVIIQDRTLVPMRAIFERLGAQVNWDAQNEKVTATKGKTVIILTINSNEALVNGTVQLLDVPATVIDDRTMVPLRFISESLGIAVRWNQDTNTATIDTNVLYKQVVNPKSPSFKYVGEVVNGLPNGLGKEYYKDEVIYEGEWKDGKRFGYGKTFYNGELASEGEFDGDLSRGKEYYDDGSVSKEKDLTLGANGYCGTVKMYYPDGKILMVAEVVDNLPTANTVYYYKDGTIAYQGEEATRVTVGMLSQLIWGDK